MTQQPTSPGRGSRRGCLIIAAVLALLLAVFAYVGFSADPVDDAAKVIPAVR